MSLAPKWAKAAAILGLKAQLLQLQISCEEDAVSSVRPLLLDKIREFAAELERIEGMKD